MTYEETTTQNIFFNFLGDYAGADGYLCDLIREQADSLVDIYTSDLLDWAKDNLAIIEEAKEEFGRGESIIQEIQAGQFLYYERALINWAENLGLDINKTMNAQFDKIHEIFKDCDDSYQVID